MIRRFVLLSLFIAVAYFSFLYFRFSAQQQNENIVVPEEAVEAEMHKVYSFSFSKYTTDGEKEIEIEGDTANVLAKLVSLNNVIAKAYADDHPVTVTADSGVFDKSSNTVHLKKNVVATTDEGARLFSPTLDIYPGSKSISTEDDVVVKKDNIDVAGQGASGDSNMKRVKFNKNVTVVIQNEGSDVPTVVTCDGPLNIDYDKNIAYFRDNVEAKDHRGILQADEMDVYYDKNGKTLDRIVCRGNVAIVNPGGNATYSDNVVYYAKDGRIVIGGDSEATFYPGSKIAEF